MKPQNDLLTIFWVIGISLFYAIWCLTLFNDWRKREFRNEHIRQLWLIAILTGFGGIFYLLRVYYKPRNRNTHG